MSSDELHEKFNVQVATCEARWKSMEDCLSRQGKDIREILQLLRGEGTDAGLVGRIQGHQEQLRGVAKTFKIMWSLLLVVIGAITGSYFTR